MKKVLVSHGYGAGWATWHYGGDQKDVAEYLPIIEFIENGGNPADLDRGLSPEEGEHPLVAQMMEDLGLEDFYTGGAGGLCVCRVDGPYRIDEYDGAESITTPEDFW